MNKAPEYIIDEGRHEVKIGNRDIYLVPKEWKILIALRDSGKIMTRDELTSASGSRLKDTRTIDQHIARIRLKMAGVKPIITVPTLGYKIAR